MLCSVSGEGERVDMDIGSCVVAMHLDMCSGVLPRWGSAIGCNLRCGVGSNLGLYA